jgi:hypothetical protein
MEALSMRYVLLALLVSVLLAPVVALTACGGGGGSAGSGDPEGARSALIQLLDAGRKDDFAKARPNLDVVQWLASNDHPQAATYRDLPKDEQEKLAKGCFRGIVSALRVVNLPDLPSISAAVKSGTIENMPQLKAVRIRFTAPDAEREGQQMAIEAKLRYGMDRVWRLETIAADL